MENNNKKRRTIDEKVQILGIDNPHALDIFRQVILLDDDFLCDRKNIEKMSSNIREEREKGNLSQKQVAEGMNIYQCDVSKYENLFKKNISSHGCSIKTRRGYLQAFALTYEVSPFYIMGESKYPRSFTSDKDMIGYKDYLIDPFSFLIVMRLFTEDEKRIKIFERVCSATQDQRTSIKRFFSVIPSVKTYVDTERSNLTDEFYEDLNKFLIENKSSYKAIKQYVRSFENLRKMDPDMYKILSNICFGANDDFITGIALCLTGGFLG